MKMEESAFIQDNGNKQTERIKVSEMDIIVKYNEGDWTLDYSYSKGKESGYCYCNLGFYALEQEYVEVISNIFDNPELLESEDKEECF